MKPRLYTILAITLLLLIVELGLALGNLVPIEDEWLLGWLLFLTLLICMGMAGLIGVVAPVDRSAVKYIYPILVALPLAIFTIFWTPLIATWGLVLFLGIITWLAIAALIGAATSAKQTTNSYSILIVVPLIVTALIGIPMVILLWTGPLLAEVLNTAWWAELFMLLVAVLYGLALALMIGAVALRTAMADKPGTPLLYIVVALRALGISAAALVLLTLVLFSAPLIGLGVFHLVPLLAAVVVSVPGTALIGMMRHPYQNIAVAAIGLWVMIIFVGWYWYAVMDDGLDEFTGEEHAAAEKILTRAESICPNYSFYIPSMNRVAKDDNGGFRSVNRTWWRLPASCYHR